MTSLIVERLFLPILAFCLSLAWLLPNHYPPWMSFHSEAFSSFILLMVAALIFVQTKGVIAWSWPPIFLFVICLIPWLQLLAGKVLFLGTAWINSVYIFGLFVSFILGYQWELLRRNECADFVFIALGIASIFSVAIQIYQYLEIGNSLWVLNSKMGRPFANVGQPNQLGSLLLLGVLAVIWGGYRGELNKCLGATLVVFLLLGVALTQSRTALLNGSLIFFVLATWAHTRALNKFKWVLIGHAVCLWVLFLGLPLLCGSLSEANNFTTRMSSNDPRLAIWHIFYGAVLGEPFGGYGWGQIAKAQIEISSPSHNLKVLYTQSHNLILDLLLWNGLVGGAFIVFALGGFFKKILISISDFRSLLLALFLVVLSVHAMLEFPLHYAYFLFPVGMVSGVLAVSSNFRPVFFTKKASLMAIFSAAITVFFVTVNDYQKVEQSYYDLLSELAGIKSERKVSPPDVIVLTQMRELILFARFNAATNMKYSEIEWMKDVARTYPSPNNFQKVAVALALNDEPLEARKWLGYVCYVFGSGAMSKVYNEWIENPKLNHVLNQVFSSEICGKDNMITFDTAENGS